jgi:hypothetical protein
MPVEELLEYFRDGLEYVRVEREARINAEHPFP